MVSRRIAVDSETFWSTHAPYASSTWLARRYPPASGGLSEPGWKHAIRRNKKRFPQFDWVIVPQHTRFRPPQGPAPLPVYEDGKPADDLPDEPNVPDSSGNYVESVQILPDGSHHSDKLLRLDAEQSKDPAYLLEMHGYDPHEWELVSARNNIYQSASKRPGGGHDVSTLYSSRITVRPLANSFCIEDVAEALRAAVTPVKVKRPKAGKCLLELPFTDLHLGNSTLEHYRETLARTLEHINSKRWAEIVLWVGSDFFHCDNFKNTTSNGTPQSSVAWPEAWRDGLGFAGTVIEAALAQAVKVHAYYIPGNHDESMSWAFCQMLEARYPQVSFDTEIAERKVHLFGECAFGMTHGDEKTRRDLDRVFIAEFPQFAAATFREVHMGHLHHEKSIDQFGVMTRSLSTAARTDKWHRETGFVGARKTFLLFEWDAQRGVTDPHYV